jgi:transcription antitermination protein NusB
MLSRRHLRIKVMQALYGYFNAGFDSITAGEKELLVSIGRYYDLFLFQISFLTEICEVARKQIEDAKQKHIPSAQELNPNYKFVNNVFFAELSANAMLADLYKKRSVSWIGENEIVRRAFSSFKEGPEYKNYMSDSENSFEKDKEIISTLIKKYLADFPPLMQFYEERSIFWVDDIDIVNMILIKIIRSCREETLSHTFTDLEWFIDDEDREFAIDLFRKTIMSSEQSEKIISEKTLNWEIERIAMMDILLMKMAVCEFTEFPSIPVKVSLNEYIDLSKMYSTPKSSIFINGILDKLIVDLRRDNRINKSGRGLM